MELFNELFKYGLHDTTISEIQVVNDGLVFFFYNGVYVLNDNGKEIIKTSQIKLRAIINGFDNSNLVEHIEFFIYKKGKRKEIDITKITDIEKFHDIRIDNAFFSAFNNSLFIKGFSIDGEIEFFIEDINRFIYNYY